MAEMNRVESAAENADRGVHVGDSPQVRSDKILDRKGREGRKGKPDTDLNNDCAL